MAVGAPTWNPPLRRTTRSPRIHDGTERDARTPIGRQVHRRRRRGNGWRCRHSSDQQRPWWAHDLAAAGSSQGGKVDGRDAAALRQAAEGDPGGGRGRHFDPGGGRYFKYRPPLGPFRPFDQDCAAEIIQKSPILHHFPPSLAMTPSQRQGAGEPGAPAPPVPGSRWSAHPQNGMLDGAITSTLHCSACSPP